MNYNKLTLVQLKEIAKEKKIKGYSKLNKQNLIILLNNYKKTKKSKNQTGGGLCRLYHTYKHCPATGMEVEYWWCSSCEYVSYDEPTGFMSRELKLDDDCKPNFHGRR